MMATEIWHTNFFAAIAETDWSSPVILRKIGTAEDAIIARRNVISYGKENDQLSHALIVLHKLRVDVDSWQRHRDGLPVSESN